jgi:3-oxoacyl-[acyl-carrier protein] reductase
VTFEQLHPSRAAAELAELGAGFLVHHLLVSDCLQVLADPKAAGVTRRAARWEGVVRTDGLVTVGNTGPLAEKEGTVFVHLRQRLTGIAGQDLDVLAGEGVRERERLVEVFDDEDLAVVAPSGRGEVAGRHARKDGLDMGDDLVREHVRCRDEHGWGVRAVLSLGQQVDRDDERVRLLVGDYQDFGGAREQVDADLPEQLPFRLGHIRVPRAGQDVDVIVHAAGIMKLTTIADADFDVIDEIMAVNTRGTFTVAQQAAKRIRSGGAFIAFSTSVVGLSLPTYGPYVASKAAVEGIILILARELRGRDITVNAVAPGPTATALFLDGKDEQTIARMAAQPPLERLGVPEDIAEAVAFLAGPARWVNGQVLRVNGGIV